MDMSSHGELIVVVDEDNQLVGTASRGVMRRFHLPHRATYVLVFNGQNEIFVHKRTSIKDIYPGYYCPAIGGVVAAGESYEEAAARELAEEVGIEGVPIQTLFDFYHQEQDNRVWGRTFLCRYDGKLVLQQEEIESGAFMSVPKALALAGRKPFTPDCLYVLRRYFEERHSLQPGLS
jgi:8-oxo-dGTP pyrophosphatase MutT (NUDIX family)